MLALSCFPNLWRIVCPLICIALLVYLLSLAILLLSLVAPYAIRVKLVRRFRAQLLFYVVGDFPNGFIYRRETEKLFSIRILIANIF